MKPAIIKWVQKVPAEYQKGDPRKNATKLKEGRPNTSARKYKEIDTQTTGTTGGGKKYKGNKKWH